jgi:DNA invertase Pin-like site-specific DNA recombinase
VINALERKLGRPVLTPNHTLVVWRLDRLGRSLRHLIDVVTDLDARGVGFRSLRENIDTTTAGGKLVFHMFGALAVISSSSADQAPDLGFRVEDGVFDTAA